MRQIPGAYNLNVGETFAENKPHPCSSHGHDLGTILVAELNSPRAPCIQDFGEIVVAVVLGVQVLDLVPEYVHNFCDMPNRSPLGMIRPAVRCRPIDAAHTVLRSHLPSIVR